MKSSTPYLSFSHWLPYLTATYHRTPQTSQDKKNNEGKSKHGTVAEIAYASSVRTRAHVYETSIYPPVCAVVVLVLSSDLNSSGIPLFCRDLDTMHCTYPTLTIPTWVCRVCQPMSSIAFAHLHCPSPCVYIPIFGPRLLVLSGTLLSHCRVGAFSTVLLIAAAPPSAWCRKLRTLVYSLR